MGMAAAAWDVLSKAANLAQMSGLHAAMLVAVLTTLLRVHHSNKRECARLERCHRRLHALLQWPATGMGDCGAALLWSEMGDPFGKALCDAAGLVDNYRKNTLWHRLWNGGSTATQLRDMQDVVNSYCGLLLFVNAHLLLQQQSTHRHPVSPSSDTSTTTIHEENDTSQSPVDRDPRGANDIGQGRRDTDQAGCKRNVPALLPIVISHG